MSKKILINGAFGRMGQLACATLEEQPEFTLVARTGKNDDLNAAIKNFVPDIVIDFTNAHCAWINTQIILQHPVYAIIGTSGLKKEQIEQAIQQSKAKKQGGIIVPNFSIGAILQMRCAEQIARYFNKAEIVEIHHPNKLDAPSGTALRTAERIQQANTCLPPIHSIRLPGFVAQQDIIFGAHAETVSITHHVLNREAYMPGLILACQKVMSFKQLYYGLEVCLDE